jgi:arsenate reductase
MEKKKVLFLCTGNSARSQMAEALVNFYLGDLWQAASAGTQPASSVNPLAIKALDEIGIVHKGSPKSLEQFRNEPFDIVITLCDDAAQNCPVWLGAGFRVHIGFEDPALATGSEEERLAFFRNVRDQIQQQVLNYLRGFESQSVSR